LPEMANPCFLFFGVNTPPAKAGGLG
jgi:hypothetical protein